MKKGFPDVSSNAIGAMQFLSRMSRISGCNGGPFSKKSLREGTCELDLAEQSYTIRILVDSAVP